MSDIFNDDMFSDIPSQPWHGGDCPVASATAVLVAYRGPARPELGTRIEFPVYAGRLDWSHEQSPDDIVAYKVLPDVEPADEVS